MKKQNILRFHNKDNVLVSVQYYTSSSDDDNSNNSSSNNSEILIKKWLPGLIIKIKPIAYEGTKYQIKIDQQFLNAENLSLSDFSTIFIENDDDDS